MKPGRLLLRVVVERGAPEIAADGVLEVSELQRAFILRVVALPLKYDPSGSNGWVMALILDELGAATASPLHVPMPATRSIRRLCESFLREPACKDDTDRRAAQAAMSRPTLTRRFRAETSMTIAEWRQQARMMEALSRIGEGTPMTAAAFEVGYDSASAFSAAFRRVFGCPQAGRLAEPGVECNRIHRFLLVIGRSISRWIYRLADCGP